MFILFMPLMPLSEMEPAVRDPKKLRLTAIILIIIMIVGGITIQFAYQKFSRAQQQDDRPAFVGRITEEKNLRLLLQDGRLENLVNDREAVSLVHCVIGNNLQQSEAVNQVMQQLAKQYQNNHQVMFTTLVLDSGPPQSLQALLNQSAKTLGAQLPQWRVASTEPQLLKKYIKKEFKATLFPHEESGKWLFDTSIFVIDKNRHLRKAVIPQHQTQEKYVTSFDFDLAKEWDQRGVKTGIDLSNQQQLQKLLCKTIDELLLEKKEAP